MRVRGRRSLLAAALCGAVALVAGCSNWPTRFERIDQGDRPRVLDFVYVNLQDSSLCEAAPGDSMMLVAYFSGVPIESIKWGVSWNVILSPYFGDAVKSVEQLEYEEVTPDVSGFDTSVTQIRAIRFRVPDDVVAESDGVSEDLLAQQGVEREEIVELLDLMATSDPVQVYQDPRFQEFMASFGGMSSDSVSADSAALDSALVFMNFFLQAMSAPARIFATINDVYKVESDFTVRYNRHLTWLPGVSVNRNPVIHFMGIHKVKNPAPVRLNVAEMSILDTTYVLFSAGFEIEPRDTLLIGPAYCRMDTAGADAAILLDTGYTYYVAVDSGIIRGEEMRDDGVTKNGTIEPETYFTQWFYQHDSTEMDGVDPNDLMIVGSGGRPVQQLLPPLDTGITTATLWVQVYDFSAGEIVRPYGSSLAGADIRFEYTDAYVEKVEKGEDILRF
ncbi:MAG: hypothetical protein GF418_07570 [Chitinivibrionales bacterium]|nr:hypothetical protein [Chitinivibrionales bacterium]MBD3395471.1 hypothetical protein [Chitinivibrionales bacterium]